jgi:hypothetical protein
MTFMAGAKNALAHFQTNRDFGVVIWLFNIGAERYWHQAPTGIVDRSEDMLVNRMEDMNLLLCRRQDYMIVREAPDPAFLNRLRQFGFEIPNFLVPNPTDPLTPISELVLADQALLAKLKQIAAEEQNVYFMPFAVTRLEEQIAEACGLQLIGGPAEASRVINDKIHSRSVAVAGGMPVCKGRVCTTVDEVRQTYQELTSEAPYFEKVIVKEPQGASGKGLYIIENESMLSSLLVRLGRTARKGGAQWLVEGWYPCKADINYQLYVSPEGDVDVYSFKQQILNGTVYIGSRMPANLTESELQQYRDYGLKIGEQLHKIGYSGVASIDSIITTEDEIIPIIEINGRFTLSTYISFVDSLLGVDCLFARYVKLATDSPVTYEDVCRLLERENLLFNRQTGEGVLPYTSGTLPTRFDEAKNCYPGRLFILVLANDWGRIDKLNRQLEQLLAASPFRTVGAV